MAHPLYPVACRLMGRHVHVHHVSGRVYPGLLHQVNQRGIYLIHTGNVSYVDDECPVATTLIDATDDADLAEVYSPLGYFAFGALGGLTLGALASRRRFGYGGYGGYGGGYGGFGW